MGKKKRKHWIEFSFNWFTSREQREGKDRRRYGRLSVVTYFVTKTRLTLYCQNGPFIQTASPPPASFSSGRKEHTTRLIIDATHLTL